MSKLNLKLSVDEANTLVENVVIPLANGDYVSRSYAQELLHGMGLGEFVEPEIGGEPTGFASKPSNVPWSK